MPPSSPYYAAAKRAMADIYLKHRKDKRAFARCYKDIVRRGAERGGFVRAPFRR